MTRYEQGFLTKCAEYGLDEEQSIELLEKQAQWLAALQALKPVATTVANAATKFKPVATQVRNAGRALAGTAGATWRAAPRAVHALKTGKGLATAASKFSPVGTQIRNFGRSVVGAGRAAARGAGRAAHAMAPAGEAFQQAGHLAGQAARNNIAAARRLVAGHPVTSATAGGAAGATLF